MNFFEFAEYAKNNIWNYLPDEYKSAKISTENDDCMKLIVNRGTGKNPKINLDEFFQCYINGMSMERIMQFIANIATADNPINPNINKEYDSNVMFATLSREPKSPVSDDFWGMSITYHALLDFDGNYAVTVNQELLDMWGVSKERVREDSISNTREILNPIIVSETWTNSEEYIDVSNLEIKVIISRMSCGASVMLTDVLEDIYRKDGAFYIVPISVDGVMLIPTEEASPKKLKSFLYEMNHFVNEKEEMLSDDIFLYDGTLKKEE